MRGAGTRTDLDAAAAVAAGVAATGLEYFFTTGIGKGQGYGTLTGATVGTEGPEFDYLASHAEVARLVASGQAKSGLAYFLAAGADQGHRYGAIAAGRLGGKSDPERLYLTANLDVAIGVAKGVFASGKAHYLTFGRAEGRVYGGVIGQALKDYAFDASDLDTVYLASHGDALAALERGEVKSGIEYFLASGVDKGQRYGALSLATVGGAGDVERAYLARNLDVAKAVADGRYASGLAHYLDAGRTESFRGGYGRLDAGTIDESALGKVERAYLAANLDVARTIATGAAQGDGLTHYLTYGYKETWRQAYGGLAGDPALGYIDEIAYLQQHRNVAEQVAVGGLDSGLFHFMRYGAVEGASWGGYTLDDIKHNFYRFSLDIAQVADDTGDAKSNKYLSALLLMANQNNITIGDSLSRISADTFIQDQSVSRDIGNAYVIAAALGFNIDAADPNSVVNSNGRFDGPGLDFLRELADYRDPTLVNVQGLNAPQALAAAPIAAVLPFAVLAPEIMAGIFIAALAVAAISALIGTIHVLSSPSTPIRTPQQRVADIAQGKLGCDNLPGVSKVNQLEGRARNTNADMTNAEFNEFLNGLRDTLTPGGWTQSRQGKPGTMMTEYYDKNGNLRFVHRTVDKPGQETRHVIDVKDEGGKRDVEKCHVNQRGKGGKSATVPTLEKLQRLGVAVVTGQSTGIEPGGDGRIDGIGGAGGTGVSVSRAVEVYSDDRASVGLAIEFSNGTFQGAFLSLDWGDFSNLPADYAEQIAGASKSNGQISFGSFVEALADFFGLDGDRVDVTSQFQGSDTVDNGRDTSDGDDGSDENDEGGDSGVGHVPGDN